MIILILTLTFSPGIAGPDLRRSRSFSMGRAGKSRRNMVGKKQQGTPDRSLKMTKLNRARRELWQ